MSKALLPQDIGTGDGVDILSDPPAFSLPPWQQWRSMLTTGNYEAEEDASKDFIAHINDEHWHVEQEVTGEVVFPKPDCKSRAVRVDYALFPRPSLVEHGWSAGPIIVEVKKSGVKVGPVISQAMDYMRCVFNGPRGQRFQPRFCVIFPLQRLYEHMQSIMSDQRIGHSHVGDDNVLRVYLNGTCAYTETGGVFLRSALKSGRKFGSR
jgi:hypothetical protein